MWSSSGGEENNKNRGQTSSSSKSSSSTSSSPSPFSPLTTLHHPYPRAKTMEEVWKDLSLTSLPGNPDYHDTTTATATTATTTTYRGMILQDFLARPVSKDPPLPTVPAAYGGSSAALHPATILTLNSGPEFQFLGNSDPLRPNSFIQTKPISQTCCVEPPFEVLGSAPSGLMSDAAINGKKRFSETDNNSGDRRHKRMIKNRESAARSRARKQAYTNELELEVAHLSEENDRLRKQQQLCDLCQAAVAPATPKKHTTTLHRTLTAPF